MATSTSILQFLAIFLGLICVSMAASCATCLISHPQQKFCDADFVFKLRPKSMQYVDQDGNKVLYGNQAYDARYEVKIETIFKGKDLLPANERTIFIYTPKDVCNIDKLEFGIRYLISGKMRGDKMEVTTCGLVEKWSDLTPSQRRGVRGFYKEQCSSCRIYGSNIIRYYGGNEIVDEMSSGLWSKQGCFFNPLASLTYASDDCETKYSYCMPEKKGGCAWVGETAYDECFRQREYKWQLMQFAELGLAAWTCPEQCKNLTPRKLKYQCKKATRRMPPCKSSHGTIREFTPDSGREAVRTVDPSMVQEAVRTVDPNTYGEVAGLGESPEIVAALSAMLDAED